jgi:diadenosine tetraphosphate (Ap4A) HIT family hydrolase
VSDCLFCQDDHRILCSNRWWYVRFDLFPATLGHVELVSRRHVESLFDVRPWEAVAGWRLLREARRLLAADYHPDAWNIGVNDGVAAGRGVHHLHIHLIPRHVGDQDDPRGGIRRGLPNGDPNVWAHALSPSTASHERTDRS